MQFNLSANEMTELEVVYKIGIEKVGSDQSCCCDFAEDKEFLVAISMPLHNEIKESFRTILWNTRIDQNIIFRSICGECNYQKNPARSFNSQSAIPIIFLSRLEFNLSEMFSAKVIKLDKYYIKALRSLEIGKLFISFINANKKYLCELTPLSGSRGIYYTSSAQTITQSIFSRGMPICLQ